MSRVRERWLPTAVEFERSLLTTERTEQLTLVGDEARLALETALERALDEEALQSRFLVNAEDLARAVRAEYIPAIHAAVGQMTSETARQWTSYLETRIPELDREELRNIGPGGLILFGAADPSAVAATIVERRGDVAPYIVYGVDEIGHLGPLQRFDDAYDLGDVRHGLFRCNHSSPYSAGWGIVCSRRVCRVERYWDLMETERELLCWSLEYRREILQAVASVREVIAEFRLTHLANFTGERKLTSKADTELENRRDRTIREAKFAVRQANRTHDLPPELLAEWKAKRKALTRGFISLDGLVWATRLYGPGALLIIDAMSGSHATERLFYDRVHDELSNPGSVPPKGYRIHP